MRSQLYLWGPLKQRYINDLSFIKTMFIERIQPIFANAEAEAEANRKIAASLTSTLIDKIKYEKWNGELPQVQGNTTPIINMN